jgi:hypothetical protein
MTYYRINQSLENCNGCLSFETKVKFNGFLVPMCLLYKENYKAACPCTNCIVKVICTKEHETLCDDLREWIYQHTEDTLHYKERSLAWPIVEPENKF